MPPQPYETTFYEWMWRMWSEGAPYPFPFWIRAYLGHWSDAFDSGLFESKEGAFASNASYRYWAMVGLPDQDVESLVGQAGEVEPVHDQYSVSFFLFDAASRDLHYPQSAGRDGHASSVEQTLDRGWLPVVVTDYRSGVGVRLVARAFAAAPTANEAHGAVVLRIAAKLDGVASATGRLCVAVTPWGPTGLRRHDRAGRFATDGRLSHIRYIATEQRLETNSGWGPILDPAPASFGVYGNAGDPDPGYYVKNNPFADLAAHGDLSRSEAADDHVAGLCSAAFVWPFDLTPDAPEATIELRMPVGDYTLDDVRALAAARSGELDGTSLWLDRLERGMRVQLPPRLARYENQFRICRVNLVILADGGEIHPGPTIYDSFWVRDSSVEGIACALVGETDLAETQFAVHYPRVFNRVPNERVGPVSAYGFFGGAHEKNDLEWDSNGQALWAFGRFDRVMGAAYEFGNGMFTPYVIDGARWIRDNRSVFGLLHSGWSAEHLGDKTQPHYWDDYWAVAGLFEAVQMSKRISAPQQLIDELEAIYEEVRSATRDSIVWVLGEQRRRGIWETFIPTGPGNVGDLDSTIVGTVAYFHPCRLHMGQKLGADVDAAARLTLETIWAHHVDGGFKHEAAWNCYGPYLTLQLAHAFLFVGQVDRMMALLEWSVDGAAYARVSPADDGDLAQGVAVGAWNEQHCYAIASNFHRFPAGSWYMGDIPHGWACAEYLMLLRDMLFFEADEDGLPHIYLLPGVTPAWLRDGESLRVADAATVLGGSLSFEATHDLAARELSIRISARPSLLHHFLVPRTFGVTVVGLEVDGLPIDGGPSGGQVSANASRIVVRYGD